MNIQTLAKADHRGFADAVLKAAGNDVVFLRKLLTERAKVFKCNDESAAQSYARAFSGSCPRDSEGARIFAHVVSLEKAAPASPMDKPLATGAGLSPSSDLTSLENMLHQHMLAHQKAHPGKPMSKTQAHDFLYATDERYRDLHNKSKATSRAANAA